jgi:hypothetical protein
MKTKLAVLLITATLMVIPAQAQPPPITIECTFHKVDFVLLNLRGYSNTKVAPKDMAWLRPGDIPLRPGDITMSFIVIGRGIGHLTASTDLRKLCVQLAKVASDHGANAIDYQIFNQGTQIRVNFLRVEDTTLQRARRQLPNQERKIQSGHKPKQ